jgi:Spy/CpxP family protein refolding chaperone
MSRRSDFFRLGVLFLAVASVLFGSPARAGQQADPQTSPKTPKAEKGRNRPEGAETPAGHVPELRDETFRLMDAYLISNLQESLGLSDDQFAKAMPLVKKLQADRRDFARRRMQALRSLRKTLVSGTATEAGVADLLKEVKSVSTEERAATVRNADALDAILTPLQQAKFRVFEAEVDARLRHLLARSQDKDRPQSR